MYKIYIKIYKQKMSRTHKSQCVYGGGIRTANTVNILAVCCVDYTAAIKAFCWKNAEM
jgi:predicted small secreted protein